MLKGVREKMCDLDVGRGNQMERGRWVLRAREGNRMRRGIKKTEQTYGNVKLDGPRRR